MDLEDHYKYAKYNIPQGSKIVILDLQIEYLHYYDELKNFGDKRFIDNIWAESLHQIFSIMTPDFNQLDYNLSYYPQIQQMDFGVDISETVWVNDFEFLFKSTAISIYKQLSARNLLAGTDFNFMLTNVLEGSVYLLGY